MGDPGYLRHCKETGGRRGRVNRRSPAPGVDKPWHASKKDLLTMRFFHPRSANTLETG